MYASLNGTRLFYDSTGLKIRVMGGKVVEAPTLLILHGGPGMDHMGVLTELAPLADQFNLVWIDHRANGRSDDAPISTWTLAQWADDVRGFCDAVGITQPVVLGQSFGGHVAQAYAARYPDHPKALIISSMGSRWDHGLTVERFRTRGGDEVAEAAHQFWGRQTAEDIEHYRALCFPVYSTTPQHDVAREAAIVRTEVMHHYLKPGGEFQTGDLRASLKSITCPTLVLAGTDDPVIPWEMSRETADALVNAPVTYVQMDGCGHGVWRDQPEAARTVLREFIQTHAPVIPL